MSNEVQIMSAPLYLNRNLTLSLRWAGGEGIKIKSKIMIKMAVIVLGLGMGGAAHVQAHPEFQQHIVKSTGRPVNCALCHTHADGPEGTAPGQIGHLTLAQQAELGRARAAFEPNAKPNSPILNAFGNHIINSIGKKKFLEARLAPGQLPGLLPKESDLDADGIPDATELAMGTHPLIKSDGNPWLLFKAGFLSNLPQILLALAATVLGLWGLGHLLRGFAAAAHAEEEAEEAQE